jgi:hypothetical protein
MPNRFESSEKMPNRFESSENVLKKRMLIVVDDFRESLQSLD